MKNKVTFLENRIIRDVRKNICRLCITLLLFFGFSKQTVFAMHMVWSNIRYKYRDTSGIVEITLLIVSILRSSGYRICAGINEFANSVVKITNWGVQMHNWGYIGKYSPYYWLLSQINQSRENRLCVAGFEPKQIRRRF
jgi:hypothetical protein